MSMVPSDPHDSSISAGGGASDLDVERDSGVPISTQIYWQIAYQIDSGRLQPGERLAPVRELGAALRVNPNTIRAVYRRLADNGYVLGRHGAGTVVSDRMVHRRRPEALGGIVSEMLRRAAQAGFTPDEVAAAAYAAASERKRPGEQVHVLFAECTTADAGYDAERLNREFTGSIEAEGTLLDERLARVAPPADLSLMSREALAQKLDQRMHRPERIRPWTYEFDPAGLELLRQKVENVAASRREPVPA